VSSGHDRVGTAHRPGGDPPSLQIIVSVPRRTHYTTLGVRPDATATEIRVAYRDLARRLHPDRTAPTGSAAPPGGAVRGGEMAAVNEAYRVLSDPGRRVVYDRSLDEVRPADGAASAPFAADPADRADSDDEVRSVPPMRPNVLAPAGPARVPWRMMGVLAVVGSGVVLVSSLFDDPAATAKPDGIIQPGSCVAFEVNGDAREVVCGTADDIVVQSLVPLDAVCPAGTVAHRDRLGLGIACVAG
jgi:molecular chaperone DnaJ